MTALAASFPTSSSSSASAPSAQRERSTAAPTPEKKRRPRWALIRHYSVLFCSFPPPPSHSAASSSSGSSPPSSPHASSSSSSSSPSPSTSSLSLANRTWHDGVLTQHTFNGKLILFDSAESSRAQEDDGSSGAGGIEVADCFASPAQVGRELLHEGREVQVGEWRVSVGQFLRVGRVDLDRVLGHGQGNKVKGQEGREYSRQAEDGMARRAMGIQNAAATGRSGLSSSPSAEKTTTSLRPNGPQSPHPFKTPFKRKAQTDDEDGQEVRKQVASTTPSSSSVSSPMQQRDRVPYMTPTVARDAVPRPNDSSIRRRRLGSRSSLSAARRLDATPRSTVDRHSNPASSERK